MTIDVIWDHLTAYIPTRRGGTAWVYIPCWLIDEYEEWLVRQYRFIQLDAHGSIEWRGVKLLRLSPYLSVAPGL